MVTPRRDRWSVPSTCSHRGCCRPRAAWADLPSPSRVLVRLGPHGILNEAGSELGSTARPSLAGSCSAHEVLTSISFRISFSIGRLSRIATHRDASPAPYQKGLATARIPTDSRPAESPRRPRGTPSLVPPFSIACPTVPPGRRRNPCAERLTELGVAERRSPGDAIADPPRPLRSARPVTVLKGGARLVVAPIRP